MLAAGAEVDWSRQYTEAATGVIMHARTALHWAVSHGTVEAVEALLAAGADVNTESHGSQTALDIAVKRYTFGTEVIVRGTPRPRPRVRRNRMVPLLVRAGATIDEDRHTSYSLSSSSKFSYADRSDYLKAVLEAGGIRAYERQHRTTLANVLNRGNRLPADVIPKIVDYWAHVGWYAIERDQRDECEVFLDSGRFGLRSREF